MYKERLYNFKRNRYLLIVHFHISIWVMAVFHRRHIFVRIRIEVFFRIFVRIRMSSLRIRRSFDRFRTC
uniref:Uncharacterized protein n=1 Tax=Octopus bimaculoides TaxID=37653 RepID=A0A0L8FKT5_OCTBM